MGQDAIPGAVPSPAVEAVEAVDLLRLGGLMETWFQWSTRRRASAQNKTIPLLLEEPNLSAKPAQLLALRGDEPFAFAGVGLVLPDHLLKDSLAMPSSSAIFGIDFSEEQ